jgi:hypothetical protein
VRVRASDNRAIVTRCRPLQALGRRLDTRRGRPLIGQCRRWHFDPSMSAMLAKRSRGKSSSASSPVATRARASRGFTATPAGTSTCSPTRARPDILIAYPYLPGAPVLPVFPVFPVAPVFPVFPVFPVAPVFPVDPVAPVAPADPEGVTTVVGLSHALNASASSTAENIIEYFIRIPLECLTKAVHLDRFAATWSCSSKLRHIRVSFRALARLAPRISERFSR